MIWDASSKNKWAIFLVNILRNSFLIVSSAIVASYISTFLNAWLLVELDGSRQFTFHTALMFSFFGAIFGPMFAWPFLVFFMLPWVTFLQWKKTNQFLLWTVVPAIISTMWGFSAALLFTNLGKILSDFSIAPLFLIAGFLTALFMWLLNKYVFKESRQSEMSKVIEDKNAPN